MKAYQHHIENNAKLRKKQDRSTRSVSIIVQGGVVLTIQVILLVAFRDGCKNLLHLTHRFIDGSRAVVM